MVELGEVNISLKDPDISSCTLFYQWRLDDNLNNPIQFPIFDSLWRHGSVLLVSITYINVSAALFNKLNETTAAVFVIKSSLVVGWWDLGGVVMDFVVTVVSGGGWWWEARCAVLGQGSVGWWRNFFGVGVVYILQALLDF